MIEKSAVGIILVKRSSDPHMSMKLLTVLKKRVVVKIFLSLRSVERWRYRGLPFLEAIRSLKSELENVVHEHSSHTRSFIKAAGERKTKPTQHSFQDFVVLVSRRYVDLPPEYPLPKELKTNLLSHVV